MQKPQQFLPKLMSFGIGLFILYGIIGCNNSGKVVKYGLNQKFVLQEGEMEVAADKDRVKVYEYLCVPTEISIPINRVVEAKTYGIYISFADSGITAHSYIELLKQDTSKIILGTRTSAIDNQSVDAVLFRSGSVFLSQYWKKAKATNMQEVFTMMTNDSTLARSVYADDVFLKNRLQE